MLEQIITACLERKGLILALLVAIVCAGVYSYVSIPIDAFPDLTNVQVEVVSNAPGLSPLEIERTVTRPIEMSMRGLPDVIEMRSVTKFGISVVTIIFEDNTDMYLARQLVFQKLDEAKERIPAGVTTELGPIATAMGEIYQYTLDAAMPDGEEAQRRFLSELRTMQEWIVAPRLKNIAGVNEVNSFGGYFRQYHVTVDPDQLIRYQLTIQEIFSAIERNNQNEGGNILEKHDEQYIVRGEGLITSPADIGNIVVQSHGGIPVYVRDVAVVEVSEAVRQGASLLNGDQEAVGGIVMMLRGGNSREVVQRVEERVREINESGVLPGGISLQPYYNRMDIIRGSISTVRIALFEGAALVLIVLLLFLKSVRGALIIMIALPVSLLLTFCVMLVFHLPSNLMSLGGLAISIGMIIDATIIQVENVQRHLRQKDASTSRAAAILRAVLDVRKPSIFGELIIASTFLPVLALQGLEGKMFAPLAVTVAIALLSSMLISIFIIPVLCSLFMKPDPDAEPRLIHVAKRWYAAILFWCMQRSRAVVGSALILLVASVALLGRLGTEFMPVMDEGAFDMDVQLLPGVSLPKAIEINAVIGRRLKRIPELETIICRIGQTGIALEARGVDKTGYTGVFTPRGDWNTASTREAMTDTLRARLSSIPGIAFGFSQPIQCRIDELVAGTRAQLIVKLFGEDMELLKNNAEQIERVLSSIDGAEDIIVERIAGQSYLTIVIDRNKIARDGLNVRDVQDVIGIAVGGRTSSVLYEGERSFDIVVRYPEAARNSVEAIGNILVPTPQGYSTPLKQIAEIRMDEGPMQISRENGQRRIGIELNVSGRDIGSFVAEAKEKIRSRVSFPPGYHIEWGGQFENQERAMRRLMVIAPAVIVLILMLLYFTFRSMRLSLVVMLSLPLGLIGGVFALLLGGQYLSVPASVGFIVLFGVAVLNGVVLVSHISNLRKSGLSLEESIRRGCDDRLRPVLMTASISIFSLIPMLFATGPGSEIQRPLATVVVGGLITSTFLTLVVMPIVYRWVEGGRSED